MMLPHDYALLAIIMVLLVSAMAWVALGKSRCNIDNFGYDATLPLRGFLMFFVIACYCHELVTGSRMLAFLNQGTPAVSLFFFMSGYGLVKSHARKGDLYLKGFLPRSLIKLFVPLAVATMFWVVIFAYRGNYEAFSRLLWPNAVGKPFVPHSWYIYALTLMYAFFFVSHKWFSGMRNVALLFVLVVSYYVTMRFWVRWPSWWYVSILSFPIGALFARIDRQFCGIVDAGHGVVLYGGILLWFVGLYCTKCATGFWLFPDLILWSLGPAVAMCLIELPQIRYGKWIGVLSLEMYLLHAVPKEALFGALHASVFYYPAVVAATIVLAAIIHPLNTVLIRWFAGRFIPQKREC